MNFKRTAIVGGVLFSSVLGGFALVETPIMADQVAVKAVSDATPVSEWLPDPALQAAVQDALGDAPLTQANMAQLKDLNLLADGITNLQGLEFATNLESIDLASNAISDITPLGHLAKLTTVSLRLNHAETMPDLAPLANSHVQDLNLAASDYDDAQANKLAAISQMPELQHLDLASNSLATMPPVAGLKNLTNLELAGNDLTDVSALGNMTQLTSLTIGTNHITNFAPVANLVNLENLSIGNNGASDISMLGTLTKLKTATFSQMGLTNASMSVFSHMTQMEKLSIDFNDQVTDLTPLANLTQLQSLNFSKDQVSDLTPLMNLKNLTSLSFSNAAVKNLVPLRDLTNLTSITMSSNHVSDLSPLGQLPNLKTVYAPNQTADINDIMLPVDTTTATLPAFALDGAGTKLPLDAGLLAKNTAATATWDGQQLLFDGVQPGDTAFISWDIAPDNVLTKNFSGTAVVNFAQAIQVPDTKEIPVKLSVLKGDGSGTTSVASNYIEPQASFEPHDDGTGTLYVSAQVPTKFGKDSIIFTNGKMINANQVGDVYRLKYAFDLSADQINAGHFIENMHVDFNLDGLIYDNWYDVEFRVTGMPTSNPVEEPGVNNGQNDGGKSDNDDNQNNGGKPADDDNQNNGGKSENGNGQNNGGKSENGNGQNNGGKSADDDNQNNGGKPADGNGQNNGGKSADGNGQNNGGKPVDGNDQNTDDKVASNGVQNNSNNKPQVVSRQLISAAMTSGLIVDQPVAVTGRPITTKTTVNTISLTDHQPMVVASLMPTKPAMTDTTSGQAVAPEKGTTAKQVAEPNKQVTPTQHKQMPQQDFTKQDTIAGIIGGIVGLALAWSALAWFKKQ